MIWFILISKLFNKNKLYKNISIMVFTYWMFYITMLFLLSYIGVIAIDKSKMMIKSKKGIDEIEEKYERLRSSRREMVVIIKLN